MISSAFLHFKLPLTVSHTASCARVPQRRGRASGAGFRTRLWCAPVELREHGAAQALDGGVDGRLQLRKVRHRGVFVLAFLVGWRKRAVLVLLEWVRRRAPRQLHAAPSRERDRRTE